MILLFFRIRFTSLFSHNISSLACFFVVLLIFENSAVCRFIEPHFKELSNHFLIYVLSYFNFYSLFRVLFFLCFSVDYRFLGSSPFKHFSFPLPFVCFSSIYIFHKNFTVLFSPILTICQNYLNCCKHLWLLVFFLLHTSLVILAISGTPTSLIISVFWLSCFYLDKINIAKVSIICN